MGICHVHLSENQIWIEGIRVDSTFRKQKIATSLVEYCEEIGRKNHALFSYMLIDTKNLASINMAKSLSYELYQTWNFYSLLPNFNSNYVVTFEKSLDFQKFSSFVKSWRWIPLNEKTSLSLCDENRIIQSDVDGDISTAILTDSEHFDNTLIVTLFSGSSDSTFQILSFLQNYAMEKNYKRIQILSKEKIFNFDSLEYKISFYLMKKFLD
ncbi:MAG: hypothetical protein MAG458_01692 [Nitrosopumilus sp.]|nr:hypothetical protein [Nitrosopumilus sp.]